MLSRRLLLCGTLGLAGCASLPRTAPFPAAGPFPELEPVRLARIGPEGLSVEIASRGCDGRPDIVFHVERRRGIATVAIARRRLQTCRGGPPGWVEVAFSRDELGLTPGEPVFLLNPLWTGPGR
ncbi:MAG: hypothetical protein ACK5SU_04895 [Phenylobacterium sp.]